MKISFRSLALVILLGASAGNAAPVEQDEQVEGFEESGPGAISAIGEALLARLKLMEQFASAAYCSDNFDSPGDPIKCSAGNCPQVQKHNTKTVLEYNKEETLTDVTGYVAVDHTFKLILVVFRGSSTSDNWFTNAEFQQVQTGLCDGCKAHSGFWDSWKDARDQVNWALKQATTAYPTYKIAVTGHSLGGAIATLAAAELRHDGYTLALYSFGAPRVGGWHLSKYITNQSGGNYRVTHFNDPVPRMPIRALGYLHVSPEYYIDNKNNEEVTANNVQVLEGSMNRHGNMQHSRFDFDAHRWYFRHTACRPQPKNAGELEARALGNEVDIIARF